MRFLNKLNIPIISGTPSGGSDGDLIASDGGPIYFRNNGVWRPISYGIGWDKLLGRKYVPNPTTANKLLPPVFGAITTAAVTAGTCYFTPSPIEQQITLTHLGINVSTAATGTAEVALYRSDGTNNTPYTRVAYVSGIDTGTTGEKIVALGSSVTLEPDLYWAAVRCTAGATLRMSATSFIFEIAGTTLYRALTNTDSSLTDPVTTTPTGRYANAVLILARWS